MAAKPKKTVKAKTPAEASKAPKAKVVAEKSEKAGATVAKATIKVKAKSATKPKTATKNKTSPPAKSPPKKASGTSSPNPKNTAPKTVKPAVKNATRAAKREKPVTEPSTVDSKSTKTTSASKESSITKTAEPKKAASKAKASKKGVGRIDTQPEFTPYTRKKNEDYMNEEQREHFKLILLDWKLQLMTEVDRTVNHMKDVAANDPDPADRATQEEEFSLELRTRDRERKLIRKIDSTIDLIDQDDYGYCESCGIEIGIQRLEARPTATQCIDCKTLDEIKERQIHG
jgi:DnaK suppressor protein